MCTHDSLHPKLNEAVLSLLTYTVPSPWVFYSCAQPPHFAEDCTVLYTGEQCHDPFKMKQVLWTCTPPSLSDLRVCNLQLHSFLTMRTKCWKLAKTSDFSFKTYTEVCLEKSSMKVTKNQWPPNACVLISPQTSLWISCNFRTALVTTCDLSLD